MVSSFSVEVELDIPRDLLWELRSSAFFMKFLVSNGALNRMDATPAIEVEGQGTARTRKQVYVPKTFQIPEIVKPIFDESYIEITDTQTWDDIRTPYEQGFSIQPSVMPNIVKSAGKLILLNLERDESEDSKEALREERCLHVLRGECSVAVPVIGYYVEQAIIANMHTFYNNYPSHINAMKNVLIKTYGDGSDKSLRAAVQRVLAEERRADV